MNNGAENLEIDIGGLPFQIDPASGQLGGIEASSNVSLSYRLSESPVSRTDLLGEVSFRKVWLDSDAKNDAPGVEESDFDFGAVIAGIRHQRIFWPDLGPTSLTGVLGKSWYGGEELSRWSEILASQQVWSNRTSSLRFGIQARFETRLDNALNDYDALGASIDFSKNLEAGGRYALGVWVRDYRSQSATIDALQIGANAWRSFDQFGPVVPRVSLRADSRDFRKWSVTPGGRTDHTIGVQLDLTWPGVSCYGFVPQTNLIARRTWSDVDIYDRNEFAVGITSVSRF